MPRPRKKVPVKPMPAFDAQAFLESAGITKKVGENQPLTVIFAQGDAGDSVLYIQKGAVRLSVLSDAGKAGVVGVLGSGDFLGEGALAGQRVRMGSATAVSRRRCSSYRRSGWSSSCMMPRASPTGSSRTCSLRNSRIEDDLVDHLFNSSEKRLARIPLLLARYGQEDKPQGVLPRLSQEMLAEMIGTTRSRVNFFINRFRKLGFIEYNGGLRINTSLLRVVLHDSSQ